MICTKYSTNLSVLVIILCLSQHMKSSSKIVKKTNRPINSVN